MPTSFDPSNITATVIRARRLHAQGVRLAKGNHPNRNSVTKALKALQEAQRLVPDHPDFNYTLGIALCHLGRFDEARAAFSREVEINPNHGLAMVEIGTCLARTDRPAEGIPFLQNGLRVTPNQPQAHFSLGKALLAQNRYIEAIAALDRAIELDPTSVHASRTRDWALARALGFAGPAADLRTATSIDSAIDQAIRIEEADGRGPPPTTGDGSSR